MNGPGTGIAIALPPIPDMPPQRPCEAPRRTSSAGPVTHGM